MYGTSDRIENNLCYNLVTFIDCPIFSILVYKRYKRFHFQCIIYNGDSDLFQNHIQQYLIQKISAPNPTLKQKKKRYSHERK